MLKLTIDNREIEVAAGTKVIEAAEQLGIMIPRFCYHPALGAVGACRICAVTFKEGPVTGIQMSCMVNAQDGMVVSTTDAEAVDFRRHVIEWLMLNHPHDCPVCDEGGHCLLQDLTIAGGHGMRRYQGLKRTHQDQYLGPLVQHEMNRCIQCYRCARYYQAYAGARDLGVMGIGSRVYFGRSQSGTLESPFSGNLIDICPTGVYTDKPSRFIGRRWDFQRSPSVCLHCSLGCNLVASARYRRVVRHEARPNPDVNGYFICDRGRYGYPYNDADDRPRQALEKGAPLVMSTAVGKVVERLGAIKKRYGAQSVAVVGSVRCSLETLVLLGACCRDNGWQGPFAVNETRKACNLKNAIGGLTEETAVSMGAVSVAEAVVVFGADPINESPMLALSLRQARQSGASITVIDPRAIDLPLTFSHIPVHPSTLGATIDFLIQATDGSGERPPRVIAGGGGLLATLADDLRQRKRVVVICGTDMTSARVIDRAADLVGALRQAGTEAKLLYTLEGPNAFAAGLTGSHSQAVEDLLGEIEAGKIKGLLVLENDLWHSYPDRQRLTAALERLDTLAVMDYRFSPLVEQADLFIPTKTLYESGGRWINQEGRVQTAAPVLVGGASIEKTGMGDHPPRRFEPDIPEGAPETASELLLSLLDEAGRDNSGQTGDGSKAVNQYVASRLGDIQDGKRVAFDQVGGTAGASSPKSVAGNGPAVSNGVTVLLVDWTFGTECLSRPAPALMDVAPQPVATLHPATADQLDLVQGRRMTITTEAGVLSLDWRADGRMAPDVVVIPRHHLLEWQVLGATRLDVEPTRIRVELQRG